jgi:hypothetical protein
LTHVDTQSIIVPMSTLAVPPQLEGATLLKDELFIGGEWQPAADGVRFDVIDPATGGRIAQVASATTSDVGCAIGAAGSRHGIDEYLDYKYVCVEGIDA